MKKLKNIDIVLIAGQSNAVGCTPLSSLPDGFEKKTFSNAVLYQEGNFQVDKCHRLIEGITLGMGCNDEMMGIEYGISEVLQNNLNGKFGIIRYALGGTTIRKSWVPRTKWNEMPTFFDHPGGSYFLWSQAVYNGINKFIENGYNPHIKALVWMQGENDSDRDEETAKAYYERLCDLIECMRAEIRNDKLPVIIGEIALKIEQYPFSEFVRDGESKFVNQDDNAVLVSTKDIPIGPDGMHFAGKEDYILGKRFGEAILPYFSEE